MALLDSMHGAIGEAMGRHQTVQQTLGRSCKMYMTVTPEFADSGSIILFAPCQQWQLLVSNCLQWIQRTVVTVRSLSYSSKQVKHGKERKCVLIVISRFLQRRQKWSRQEPAYSQALVQNKIDRQRIRFRVRQADSQTAMVDGVWSWDGEGGREKRMNKDRICWRAVF